MTAILMRGLAGAVRLCWQVVNGHVFLDKKKPCKYDTYKVFLVAEGRFELSTPRV